MWEDYEFGLGYSEILSSSQGQGDRRERGEENTGEGKGARYDIRKYKIYVTDKNEMMRGGGAFSSD